MLIQCRVIRISKPINAASGTSSPKERAPPYLTICHQFTKRCRACQGIHADLQQTRRPGINPSFDPARFRAQIGSRSRRDPASQSLTGRGKRRVRSPAVQRAHFALGDNSSRQICATWRSGGVFQRGFGSPDEDSLIEVLTLQQQPEH